MTEGPTMKKKTSMYQFVHVFVSLVYLFFIFCLFFVYYLFEKKTKKEKKIMKQNVTPVTLISEKYKTRIVNKYLK